MLCPVSKSAIARVAAHDPQSHGLLTRFKIPDSLLQSRPQTQEVRVYSRYCFFCSLTHRASLWCFYLHCSGSHTTAVIKHRDRRQPHRGKDLSGLYFQVTLHHWWWSGQKLKQQLEAETMEEGGSWLLRLSLGSHPAYTAQACRSRERHHPQWADPPTSIHNQDSPSKARLWTNINNLLK